MDTYSVEFRISGVKVHPSAISEELGLSPSMTYASGELLKAAESGRLPLWCFAGDIPFREWHDLEEGIGHILGVLELKETIIKRYLEIHDVFWWCGHFQSSFDGGPTLSANLLGRLGALGAPLLLRNYFSNDEP